MTWLGAAEIMRLGERARALPLTLIPRNTRPKNKRVARGHPLRNPLGHKISDTPERLEANEEIALMEKEYATRESSALWEAERIRKQQEENYILEIERVNADNARINADALRVREQFNQLQSRRSPDIERCNNRVQRCEQLLSEAYDLAGEGEGLLRDRDARLKSIKR